MLKVVIWRVGSALLTIFIVLAACFAAVRMTGSPVDFLYGDGATTEQIAELERLLGEECDLPAKLTKHIELKSGEMPQLR